jgi:hypothetical protein
MKLIHQTVVNDFILCVPDHFHNLPGNGAVRVVFSQQTREVVMSSHILKIFLLCLALLMVLLPVQAAVTVSTAAQLAAAVDEANAGGEQTILVADGTYHLSNMLYITGDSITIQGQSGNRDAVILRGQGMDGGVSHVFLVRGSHFTVRDMTIGWVYNHGIQIQGEEGASHVTVSNVRVADCYEQLIKVSYNPANSNFSSHGLVEDSLLEYTAGIGPQYYIGGIDAHRSHNWIIRNNIFKNIASPGDSLAEHAIHFWSGSEDTLVEGNLIIDCDRGIGFGMGGRGHVRGVIRNNMIYHSMRNSDYADVGIDLQSSTDVSVYNNTIFFQHDYPNAIEYRFAATTGGFIANNLTNKAIAGRDGATATVTHNITSAAADWFVDPFEGDFHLAAAEPAVLDQGTDAIPGLPSPFLDFDGEQRSAGSGIDIGADEFGAVPIDPEMVVFHVLTAGSPNYTVPADTYAHVYGTSLSNVITLESGAKVRLINFPGQNAIQIQASADVFTVSRSGTVVTFEGSDGTVLKMPVTATGQTITFNGEQSRVLQIYDNQVMLDDLTVTADKTDIPADIPTVAPALIQPENLVYQGAFLFPESDAWAYSGHALAYYPPGNSLYTATHAHDGYVGEISIPSPVISSSVNDLPRAEIRQAPADITGGWKDNCTFDPECIYRELDGLAYLPNINKMAWNLRDWYNVAKHDQDSLGWSNPDMTDARGVWHIGERESDNDLFHNARTSNYLFTAPEGFAAQWLNNKRLIAGGTREAGALGGSQGPTLFALAPWEDGSPPAAGASLDALPLLYYPENVDCVWEDPDMCMYPDYRAVDQWNGGAWMDTPAGSAIVITGKKGLGPNCYGEAEECGNDPCVLSKGYHAYPYQGQILFYDPEDIKAVQCGTRSPWQVFPYEVMSLEHISYMGECSVIGAAAWDAENRRLFITEKEIDDTDYGFWGVTAVHVWQLQ